MIIRTIGAKSNHSSRFFSTIHDTTGFIGLGNMGLPMSRNLFLGTDHQLILYDVNYQAIPISQAFNMTKERNSNRIQMAKNIKQVAQSTSTVITMLPNDEAVRSVYFDNEGLLKHGRSGSLLIDSSTISPELAQEVFTRAKKQNINFIDAPVSGGVGGAEKATLAFMVGGERDSFERAKSVLSHMGKNIMYCGSSGLGQVSKICNNLLLAISMVGTSEVLHLGKKLGMDPELLTNVINASSGRCWSSEIYNPVPNVISNVPSSREYQGGFSVKLMCKDLGLALDSASRAKANVFLGSLTKQLYQLLGQSKEYQDKDFSIVYKFLDHQNISNK